MKPLLSLYCCAGLLMTLLGTSSSAVVASSSSSTTPPWGVFSNSTITLMDIPARRMWGWGFNPESGKALHGYCGSMSFQMAGIFLGNYISEERVRYAAGDAEVLIGDNSYLAASKLHYTYDLWEYAHEKTPQSKHYIQWAAKHVDQGHTVITGWYERKPHGDEDYDHIMPIIGYTTDDPSNPDHITGLYHHDLYLNDTTLTQDSQLHSTRKECEQAENPVQPYDYCLPKKYDYGIAVTGLVDKKNELFRTQLIMPTWNEPDWGKEDGLHQKPVLFNISAIISGLTAGTTYTILRFDTPESVPNQHFLGGSYGDAITFTPHHSTHKLDLTPVMSDGTWFYRTVEGKPSH